MTSNSQTSIQIQDKVKIWEAVTQRTQETSALHVEMAFFKAESRM